MLIQLLPFFVLPAFVCLLYKVQSSFGLQAAAVLCSSILVSSSVVFVVFENPPSNWRRSTVFNNDPTKIRHLPIIHIVALSGDTKLFRLAFPRKDMASGVPIGKTVLIHAPNPLLKKAALLKTTPAETRWNLRPCHDLDETIVRRYGIVSHPDIKGFCEFLVKIYSPNDEYPDGGMMSSYLAQRKVGDLLAVSAPFGRVSYVAPGTIVVSSSDTPSRTLKTRAIGMVLGGTGISPGFAIAQRILTDPHDDTTIWMLYTNKTSTDILLRSRLEEWAAQYPNWFHLKLIVNSVKLRDDFDGDVGPLSRDVIRENMPPVSTDPLICVVGPPAMVVGLVKPALRDLGYDLNRVLPF